MNPALYEHLGVRNSSSAIVGLLLVAGGVMALLLGVWAVAHEGVDPAAVTSAVGSTAVAIGTSMQDSLDALASIVVTVLLGFYVAMIGGQISPGFDVVSLRFRLSTAALILAVCFCSVASFRIAALVSQGAVGAVLNTSLQIVIIVSLAVELSSGILLRRQRQLEQNQRVVDRSRTRIRRAVLALDDPLRKHPIRSTVAAIVITALPSLILAALTPGGRWSFVPYVLGLVLFAHVAFLLVHYARVADGLRWLSWIMVIVPVVYGLMIVLRALELIAAGLPWAGAAVLSSFLVVAIANLSARGAVRTVLSLRHLAVRVELAEAVASRRRALRRRSALAAEHDAVDESALLAWLQRR